MKDKIELNTGREFSDILSDTFKVLFQNLKELLKAYVTICSPFLVGGILVNVLYQSQITEQGASAAFFSLTGLFSILFTLLNYTALMLTGLSYLALYRDNENQAPTVKEVWAYFRYYFFRLFFAELLITIAMGIGFLFCFLPGVYIFPACMLVPTVMVMENTNLEYAVRRSFSILKENWWMAFGITLLVTLITLFGLLIFMAPAAIFYGASSWLTGRDTNITYTWIQAVITHITQILWMLPVISSTLLYFSLTEQKDAGSLVNRINMFGKNNNPPDQSSFEQY